MMCDRRTDPNETVAPQRPTRHEAGPSRLFEDQPISSGELKGRTGLKTPTFGCYVKGIPSSDCPLVVLQKLAGMEGTADEVLSGAPCTV